MNTLALLGGTPTIETPFPQWPIFGKSEQEAILPILNSGQWDKDNPIVKNIEQEFAHFQGCKYGLVVTNGTHSLEIILRGLGIGYGDEVIVPDYTFVATASAVIMVGAKPILVDVCSQTMTLDPAEFEKAISPKTKAVMVVHLGGIIGHIDDILRIAKKYEISVIEDAAHAHGSTIKGKLAGSLGIAGSFSFQTSKTLTSGEGGAIVTNNKKLFEKCWTLVNCGRKLEKSSGKYYEAGSNCRMTAFQAAILSSQLKRFKTQIPQRLYNIKILDDALSQIEGITPQYRPIENNAPGYLYIFYYDTKAFNNLHRRLFVEALKAEGIPSSISAFPPLHQTGIFKKQELKFPNTEQIASKTVWIPHPVLLGNQQQIEGIIKAIQKIQDHSKKLNSMTNTLVLGKAAIQKKIESKFWE
ncbi:DegT/DnrJ/EryC1/StrS family aminotransferase [Crocosphaera sp.]|uniref:DegT/DnrJ/EryC1/StrS family aminotransferase n=1 Tax=Crocosphaera sp. TaxID=2729996 RepID=UPI003F1F607B|nr:DegT/DnrJ/EryC1/StrS family aminotransferase [Crocosphaera sp.]